MTPEEREKLEAEAREWLEWQPYCDLMPHPSEITVHAQPCRCADSRALADLIERLIRDAVAERDAHWTRQEMGVASKCDEHCQQAVREALRNYARCPACLEADLDAREKRTE
jgi:hypothetical protein